MDIAVGARRVIAMMRHLDKSGRPKIVVRCDIPLTARRRVTTIATDLAIIDVTPQRARRPRERRRSRDARGGDWGPAQLALIGPTPSAGASRNPGLIIGPSSAKRSGRPGRYRPEPG